MTRLSVSVRGPATTREVSIQQLERWVDGGGKNPRDILLEARVRELLDPKAG